MYKNLNIVWEFRRKVAYVISLVTLSRSQSLPARCPYLLRRASIFLEVCDHNYKQIPASVCVIILTFYVLTWLRQSQQCGGVTVISCKLSFVVTFTRSLFKGFSRLYYNLLRTLYSRSKSTARSCSMWTYRRQWLGLYRNVTKILEELTPLPYVRSMLGQQGHSLFGS